MASPLFIGFSFPFRKGQTSFPESASDDDLIKESLTQLILTNRGERVMRPDVGSSVYSYIFESDDILLLQRAELDISAIIAKYESRVALRSVLVERGTPGLIPQDTSILITIRYVVLLTRRQGTLTINLEKGQALNGS